MAETTTSVPTVSKPRRIHPTRVKAVETSIRTHCVAVEPGVPFDALKDPAFWSMVAKVFTPGDKIEVRTDDGSYAAGLYVVSIRSQAVVVVPIWYLDLSKIERPSSQEEYHVAHAGPHHKWRVVRKSDKAIMQHGFESEAAANAYKATLIRDMAA